MRNWNKVRIMALESAIFLITMLLILIVLLNYKIVVYDDDNALLEYLQSDLVIDKNIQEGIHIDLSKSIQMKGKTITIKYNFAAVPDTNSIWYTTKRNIKKW